MDYKKNYIQLRKFVTDLYPQMSDYCKEKVEGFLPELKGCNDEKIRNAIVALIDQSSDRLSSKNQERMLAWLARQGKACKIAWHGISEEPLEQKELLCEWDGDTDIWHDIALCHADTKTFWNGELELENVVRWAYLHEILEPQGEQKQVSITDEWIENYWQHEKVNNPYSYDKGDEIQFDHQGFVTFCKKYCQKPNPYSGVSFEHNGHVWGMCARDNGVDILLDRLLFRHLETQGEQTEKSVDDKIRNFLIKTMQGVPNGSLLFETIDKSSVIAWLEQYAKACNAIAWHDITEEPNEQVELLCKWETIDTVYHDVAHYHANDKTFWNGRFKLANVAKWAYLDELTEQVDAQKSTCTIKPKFKVGDWVVNKQGHVWHIDSFDKKNYKVSDGRGHYCYFSIPYQDEMHLWTIADAKDGDVLVNGSNIFIFRAIDGKHLMRYCHVNTDDGLFYDSDKNACFCLIDDIVTPATKEQRYLLFEKMKAAGYEWNADTKELKKIEQSPADNVESKFKVGDNILYKCDLYKITNVSKTSANRFIYDVDIISAPSEPEEVVTSIVPGGEGQMRKVTPLHTQNEATDALIDKAKIYIAEHFLVPGMDQEIDDFVDYMHKLE